jgi:hypothetical protein
VLADLGSQDSRSRTIDDQFTVSVNVAVLFSVPDVAVTVTVEVTGCVPPPPPPLPDPPHPPSTPDPAAPTASSTSISTRRRFLNPKQQTITATAAPGNSAPEPCRISAVVEDVLTVNVVVETPAAVGAVKVVKLHAAPAGNPEQANTFPLNPPSSCTVIVDVPLAPAVTVIDVGFIDSV